MNWWNKLKQSFTSSRSESKPVDLNKLQQILGHSFKQPALIGLALTHRSLVRAHNGGMPSNERLEFLGDSVLGLVIAAKLFQDHPDLAEGDLTKKKAMLVNEAALSRVAMEIGLNEHILLSADEERSGGRERPSIVSDAFEAVIGAVYLDGGLESARRMILNCLYARREAITNDSSQQNYKGDLLELVQAGGDGVPHYTVTRESGPDHGKTFYVTVTVENDQVGEGTGASKKDAEQKAARMALDHLGRNPESN
jgi:ribonuclease-3